MKLYHVIIYTLLSDIITDNSSTNFKWIRFSSIVHDEKLYYVFMLEASRGFYRYPNIQEDWIKYSAIDFFIISSEQYQSIKNIVVNKEQKEICIESKIYGSFMNSDFNTEKKLLSEITTSFSKKKYSEYILAVSYQFIDNKDIVRFNLPEQDMRFKKDIPYLKDRYFEVSLKDFMKILKL